MTSFTHSCFVIYFFRLTSKIIFTAKVSSSKKRKNLNANDRSGDSDNDSDHDELRTSTTPTTEPTPLDHRQWFSMSDSMVFGSSSSHNTLDQTDMMMVRKQKNKNNWKNWDLSDLSVLIQSSILADNYRWNHFYLFILLWMCFL